MSQFIKRYELQILLFLSLMAVVYFSWDMTSWKFAYVGDEWPFFDLAKNIAHKNLLVNPLSIHGVYDENPVLSSFYQAIFLKILGASNFTWRFSHTVLIVPMIFFFYHGLKKLFNSEMALISTAILLSSDYLANFFKIGKNMPLAVALLIISISLSIMFSKRTSAKNGLFLGLILGAAFYVYIGPLFPLIVFPFLLPLFRSREVFKKNIKPISVFGVTYIIIAMSRLIQGAVLSSAVHKTVLYHEFTNQSQILVNIFHNFLLYYKNYDYLYNHFVTGPYVDVITRIFVLAGTIITLFKIREYKYFAFFASYCLSCIVIGLTSPYSYAPTTRGLFILPYAFFFAGVALNELRKKTHWLVIFLLLISIFALNFYRSQWGVFKETNYHVVSLILKELQDSKKMTHSKRIIMVQSPNISYNQTDLYKLREVYGLSDVPLSIVSASSISCRETTDSRLLYLQRDIDAKKAIDSLRCPATLDVKELTHYFVY